MVGGARRLAVAAFALWVVGLLTGCGSITATPGSGPSYTAAPIPATRLVVRGLVVDSGKGPHLCLGGGNDFRPDCGEDAIPLKRWTWPAQGTERVDSSYTSGNFKIVGTYDGRRFTVDPTVPVTSGATIPQPGPPTIRQGASICPPPHGGWPTVAPPGATLWASLDANDLAQKLPGYGGSWIDDHNNKHAYTATLDVLVTHDVAGAERRLRKVWSGSLCVGLTTHPFTQLEQISDEVTKLPGFVSGGGIRLQSRDGNEVAAMGIPAEVVYDDGTLQRQFDEKYGVGLVEITCAMQPYTG